MCQANRTWSGFPKCSPHDCGEPRFVANARVNVTSTLFETVLRYQCNVGYNLHGTLCITSNVCVCDHLVFLTILIKRQRYFTIDIFDVIILKNLWCSSFCKFVKSIAFSAENFVSFLLYLLTTKRYFVAILNRWGRCFPSSFFNVRAKTIQLICKTNLKTNIFKLAWDVVNKLTCRLSILFHLRSWDNGMSGIRQLVKCGRLVVWSGPMWWSSHGCKRYSHCYRICVRRFGEGFAKMFVILKQATGSWRVFTYF